VINVELRFVEHYGVRTANAIKLAVVNTAGLERLAGYAG